MLIELPETFIDAIAELVWLKVGSNLPPQEETDPKVLELRRKLALINEKEFIYVAEAALLLNCSDGHIRNLVKKAKKNKTKNPIPFTDLDGPTVFKRVELLDWAEKCGRKLRAA